MTILNINATICHHHEQTVLRRFSSMQKTCFDLFKAHKKAVNIICHKDYVNLLSPPETVSYVNESFDETLICKKARNSQIFLTILQNKQILFFTKVQFFKEIIMKEILNN